MGLLVFVTLLAGGILVSMSGDYTPDPHTETLVPGSYETGIGITNLKVF